MVRSCGRIGPSVRFFTWPWRSFNSLFFLTAGAFKTVFQVFAGPERDNTNIQPPSFAQNLLLGVMSLLALATAIAPNILSMPVHRLTALFDAAYAPFLAWVEPEIGTALFLLTQFQPSLDVLAGPQEQWILYGLIWGATLAGWLFAYLNLDERPKIRTPQKPAFASGWSVNGRSCPPTLFFTTPLS